MNYENFGFLSSIIVEHFQFTPLYIDVHPSPQSAENLFLWVEVSCQLSDAYLDWFQALHLELLNKQENHFI